MRNRIVFCLIFLCAFVPLWLCPSPVFAETLDDGEHLQFADGLYARGMYDLAIEEYEAFLRDFPGSPGEDVVHFRMGECHRHLGNRSAAEKEFRRVFVGYPDSWFRFRAGFRRAEIFLEAGQHDAAIELFQAVLKEGPPEDIASASMYFLGEAFLKSGKTSEAVKTFEQVKERYASSSFCSYALLKLGQVYSGFSVSNQQSAISNQNFGKALELYRAAAAKPASDRVGAEALFQTAELYFRRKTFDKSAQAYKKLLTSYPTDQRCTEARLQAAWAAHNAGLYAEALRYAKGHLNAEHGAADPQSAIHNPQSEWLYLKANCERQLMNNKEAVRTYSQLLKQYPVCGFASAARYEKAITCYKMGEFKEAVAEAGKIKLTPDLRKDVYWLLAESYSALKEKDDAIQYYRLLVKEFPKSDVSCDAAYRLAHHLQAQGEYKEASRYYNTVAGNFPESKLAPQALFASGFCLAKENVHAEAVRDWSLLVRKYPSDSLVEESLYQKAMGEIRLRRDNEALASLRELVKKFPKTGFAADAHYWQGMLLKEAGTTQDAEDEFRLALKSAPRKELAREAKFHLGTVLQELEKFDEAANLFQSLLSSPLRVKFSPALLEWLSEYRFDKKNFRESIAAAQLLVERSSEDTWQQIGWCLIGRAHFAQGDTKSAEKAFRKSLAAKAATRFAAESALRLGDIAWAAKNYKGSSKYFEQAAGLASDDSMLGIRACAYAGLARTAKARPDLESAARYFMSVAILYDDPELVPECLYEAAEAFRKLGKNKDAGKAVDELRERYPESKWAKEVGTRE